MIETLPGLVFDYISGLLAQLVFDIFSNEKKISRSKFHTLFFYSTFMRSKSNLVWERAPYSAPEVSELGARTWHLSPNKCRTWTWCWSWRSMRTVKKSWIQTRTMRLIIFSQPSIFIRGHLHAQLEHGWWHRAITIPPRKLRTFAQTPLGYGLYSLFLIFGCFLISYLFYSTRNQE